MINGVRGLEVCRHLLVELFHTPRCPGYNNPAIRCRFCRIARLASIGIAYVKKIVWILNNNVSISGFPPIRMCKLRRHIRLGQNPYRAIIISQRSRRAGRHVVNSDSVAKRPFFACKTRHQSIDRADRCFGIADAVGIRHGRGDDADIRGKGFTIFRQGGTYQKIRNKTHAKTLPQDHGISPVQQKRDKVCALYDCPASPTISRSSEKVSYQSPSRVMAERRRLGFNRLRAEAK